MCGSAAKDRSSRSAPPLLTRCAGRAVPGRCIVGGSDRLEGEGDPHGPSVFRWHRAILAVSDQPTSDVAIRLRTPVYAVRTRGRRGVVFRGPTRTMTAAAAALMVVGLGACGSADPSPTIQGEVNRFEVGVGDQPSMVQVSVDETELGGLRSMSVYFDPDELACDDGDPLDVDVPTPEFQEAVSGGRGCWWTRAARGLRRRDSSRACSPSVAPGRPAAPRRWAPSTRFDESPRDGESCSGRTADDHRCTRSGPPSTRLEAIDPTDAVLRSAGRKFGPGHAPPGLTRSRETEPGVKGQARGSCGSGSGSLPAPSAGSLASAESCSSIASTVTACAGALRPGLVDQSEVAMEEDVDDLFEVADLVWRVHDQPRQEDDG